MSTNLRIEKRDDVAVLFIDVAGQSVNTLSAALIDEAERVMSEGVVRQPDTEMRIARSPCQLVPPAQHTRPACTRAITAGVMFSPVRDSNRTSTWFRTMSFRTRAPGSRRSASPICRAASQRTSP